MSIATASLHVTTTATDREVLRALAGEVAAIAALPIQAEKRRMWRRLNALTPVRPMVMIDQVCWSELEEADPQSLALRCQNGWCRHFEQQLRRILHQWRHFAVDMVVEPWINVPLAIHNSGFGIGVVEEQVATDTANNVVSHAYSNVLTRDEDLEKVLLPRISHDRAESERRLEQAEAIFGGVLPIRPWGADPYLSIWDPISTWMGAEGVLMGLADRPEFMHALAERMTQGYLGMLDQLEEQNLLAGPQSLIHCTGAWTDQLPAAGHDAQRWRCRDMWMFGLAQVLGSASPRMFREFEVPYASRICERFGLVYYGCCDPLDRKMAEVRMMPKVRKVSMSPWADQARGAAAIGRDLVFSRKPNPSHLAMTSWDGELVRRDLTATRAICAEHGCPLEYILKDLSTVRHQPQRLYDWAETAMRVAQG